MLAKIVPICPAIRSRTCISAYFVGIASQNALIGPSASTEDGRVGRRRAAPTTPRRSSRSKPSIVMNPFQPLAAALVPARQGQARPSDPSSPSSRATNADRAWSASVLPRAAVAARRRRLLGVAPHPRLEPMLFADPQLPRLHAAGVHPPQPLQLKGHGARDRRGFASSASSSQHLRLPAQPILVWYLVKQLDGPIWWSSSDPARHSAGHLPFSGVGVQLRCRI